MDVAVVGRFMDEEARDVKRDIESAGRKCLLIAAEVSRPEDCARCVEETMDSLGRLDLLFHCAGGPALGTLQEADPSVWYGAFDVHVHPIFHLCRAAIPHIKRQGEGAILLMSSAAGLRGCPGAFAYQVVKGAVAHLTRALARELANDNIRVNCVAPGVIRTRFQDYLTPEQVKNNLENRIPLHREGSVEDVAQLLAMLAENEFMTGEVISIDGGLTMRIA